MPVRVAEPHHPLSPGVLLYRVDVLNGEGFQPSGEGVKIVFLKVELGGVASKGDMVRFDKRPPGLQGLQAEPAGEGFVGAEVQDDPKPQDGLVKRQGPRHIRYRQQGIFQFHTGKPP